MEKKPRVLVTGAMGLIARKIIPLLEKNVDLRLTDITAGSLDGREVLAIDITDLDAVVSVVQDVDAIVHLAIASQQKYVTDRDLYFTRKGEEYFKYNEAMLDANIRGTYSILEAARIAGVPRVVYGSSLTIVMGQPRTALRGDHLPPMPQNLYAVTKLWGEQLGEYYSREDGLRFYGLRFGHPHPQPNDPNNKSDAYARSHLATFADIERSIECALATDGPRYGCYTIVSKSEMTSFDTTAAAEIGWRPLDYCHADGSITSEAA